MIIISEHLKFNIVAEEVENLEIEKNIKGLAISTLQGFYYFKPMEFDEFLDIYNRRKTQINNVQKKEDKYETVN